MSDDRKLEEYSAKRDFRSIPEPSDSDYAAEEGPIFVVQKHDASNLHYDFRLEMDGVLKSWAVPKGPPTDPKERRLAIRTEDHPMGYADFEGVIPEGEYGAGVVMVWDKGIFENLEKEDSLLQSLDDGHLKIRLDGEKLKGGYALIRTGDEGDGKWLLIKMKGDENESHNLLADKPHSVLTGRSLEQIAKEG